jgi:hypothetical protein
MQELIAAVQRTTNRGRIARINLRAVTEMGVHMMQRLRQNQPTRTWTPTVDPPRYTREEHIAISRGWRGPRSGSTAQGHAVVEIGNVSGHIDVQRTGRSPNSLTARQSFWLRPETVRNSEMKARLERRVATGKHPIVTLMRTQRKSRMPPWGGQDFVEKSAREEAGWMQRLFITAGREAAHGPLREFFEG